MGRGAAHPKILFFFVPPHSQAITFRPAHSTPADWALSVHTTACNLSERASGSTSDAAFCLPQVLREGTKKTVFVNFAELAKAMHRAPEHVITFLLAELGAPFSLF